MAGMGIGVPKFVVCPFCENPFERGSMTFQLTCPHCRRYVKITDVKKFYRRVTGYHKCDRFIIKIDARETKKIRQRIKKFYS